MDKELEKEFQHEMKKAKKHMNFHLALGISNGALFSVMLVLACMAESKGDALFDTFIAVINALSSVSQIHYYDKSKKVYENNKQQLMSHGSR
ncbi:MAG: hypothetical protein LBJ73_01550 [Rickettsiales bacterium]|nr:hypothetical protein [Rickettsiales bacterium]